MFFSFCQHHSFFPFKQGFEPAVLVFQPLVYGHDIPVPAAAAHRECHQLLLFPTLLEPCEEIIFLGLVRGPPQPRALFLYLPRPTSSQVEPGGRLGTAGQFPYAINVSIAFADAPATLRPVGTTGPSLLVSGSPPVCSCLSSPKGVGFSVRAKGKKSCCI